MDNKIKLALENLRENAISKVQKVRFLEEEIIQLKVENTKLYNKVIRLKVQEKDHDQIDKTSLKKSISEFRNDDVLINDDTSQDVAISIRQLKNIFNKSSK